MFYSVLFTRCTRGTDYIYIIIIFSCVCFVLFFGGGGQGTQCLILPFACFCYSRSKISQDSCTLVNQWLNSLTKLLSLQVSKLVPCIFLCCACANSTASFSFPDPLRLHAAWTIFLELPRTDRDHVARPRCPVLVLEARRWSSVPTPPLSDDRLGEET